MKMKMISYMTIFVKRKLHTIVSSKIIKPSFPTPYHLKTYNLSVYDQFIPGSFVPLVAFYQNTGIYHGSHEQMLDLKNSLSHILTKYYPFAGRHAKMAPTYVDCNDHGAEFIESSVDCTISEFVQNSLQDDLDQLFPHGRTWRNSNRSDHNELQSDIVIPLAVKANHFKCGGIALAVSLSHKIADSYSLIHFLRDWANTTRACSRKEDCDVSIEPHFLSFANTNINFSGFSLGLSNNCVTRTFVFPNPKIDELKIKVRVMTAGSGQHITNPTRVEVLTWLLYKCAVGAATKNNSGSLKPTCIRLATNLRDKMIEPLPEGSIGNFLTGIEVQTTNEIELKPELFIGEVRNQKMKIHNLKNIEAAFAPLMNTSLEFDLEGRQRKFENAYVCSSLCRYLAYRIDFGWGTPMKATVPGNLRKNSFILMDTPNNEGIEALVCLGKQDMEIMQLDSELLSFANVS